MSQDNSPVTNTIENVINRGTINQSGNRFDMNFPLDQVAKVPPIVTILTGLISLGSKVVLMIGQYFGAQTFFYPYGSAGVIFAFINGISCIFTLLFVLPLPFILIYGLLSKNKKLSIFSIVAIVIALLVMI